VKDLITFTIAIQILRVAQNDTIKILWEKNEKVA